ncbi:MAG: hypothetical protein QXW84_00035 [Archaeoglobaceae archaeon]
MPEKKDTMLRKKNNAREARRNDKEEEIEKKFDQTIEELQKEDRLRCRS